MLRASGNVLMTQRCDWTGVCVPPSARWVTSVPWTRGICWAVGAAGNDVTDRVLASIPGTLRSAYRLPILLPKSWVIPCYIHVPAISTIRQESACVRVQWSRRRILQQKPWSAERILTRVLNPTNISSNSFVFLGKDVRALCDCVNSFVACVGGLQPRSRTHHFWEIK